MESLNGVSMRCWLTLVHTIGPRTCLVYGGCILVAHPLPMTSRTLSSQEFAMPVLNTLEPSTPTNILRSPPPSSFTDAAPPFDDRDADVVLRSGDHVDFRVYGIILSLASPVFKTMFTLPTPSRSSTTARQNDDDHRDGLPIVPLSEDADILDPILRACYPGAGPHIDHLGTLHRALVASEKYQIVALCPWAELVLTSHLNTSPVEVYALSCSFGYPHLIPTAAKAALAIKFDDLIASSTTALRSMDNIHFRRLLQYHRKCGEAASRVAITRSCLEVSNYMVDGVRVCECQEKVPEHYDPESATKSNRELWAPPLVWEYLERAAYALKERPIPNLVLDSQILPDNPVRGCGRCHIWRTAALNRLASRFYRLVREAIDQVDLPAFT
ncbi:uncharacterized protein STEHIDRAFT_114876 [Stereum hirsutum FP-91666 SS1]|uniref:uncharacterized protein n=1 Tax=Stereum hirsutum (strain FP-91666) TaxID=721885 RepID=UPI0004449B37|nr:uncharacterized protein STEHIDRAFT_114876 [Stereum hirsutum FP-91666 SS1]EIM81425.1 hypothetical protein STEHIDRAFT_114876 [Stereum hirsutum FP-91666 SS1]